MNAIREEPLKYLPEVSLTVLWMFYMGYIFRYYKEGHSLEDDVDHQAFDCWLRARFGVSKSYFNIFAIVQSFASNDAKAFDDFFALRDEFLRTADTHKRSDSIHWPIEQVTLIDLLKKIRERPPLYFGSASFRSCNWFLMGEERAYSDLSLPLGDDRKIFSEFKRWVEQHKNEAGLPRSWHVIVSYYGIGGDCGHTVNGAFTLFYRWLDEFAATRGEPGLFKVAENWWERKSRPDASSPSWPG
jgi:hypothetical protein